MTCLPLRRVSRTQGDPRRIGVQRQHAVVVGASMAGLVAARAAARHYDRVTVLERQPEPPPGTSVAAQGSMIHALLQAGSDGLEALFPGLRAELVGRGAMVFTPDRWQWWWRGPAVSIPSSQRNLMLSRALLESTVREAMAGLDDVEIQYGRSAHGLVLDQGAVVGVRTADGDLDADLVLDCTGRAAASDRWLAEQGLATPRVVEIGVDLRYSQVTIPVSEVDRIGPLGMAIQPVARIQPRSGMALRVEGERWHVILASYFGEQPPTDPDGFRTFARDLPAPYIADLLDRTSDLGTITSYRFPSSRRREWPKGAQPPGGLVALGDSVASFNPLFGQGMSVAVMEAVELDRLLGEGLDQHELAVACRLRFAALAEQPWQFVNTVDLSFPEAKGQRTTVPEPVAVYLDAAFRASLVDPVVRRIGERIQNLQAPVTELLKPSVALRVLATRRQWQEQCAGPWYERDPLPDAPERFGRVRVDDAPIRMDDIGAGHPTLFLHGVPETSECWAGVVERLSGQMRCLVPDLPGFGRSGIPPSFEPSKEGVGDFTAALLDAAGLAEPVDVVGHDFGAAFAMSLAIEHPERVRRLVVTAGAGYAAGYTWHPNARCWRTPVLGEVEWAVANEPVFVSLLSRDGVPKDEAAAMFRRITPVTKRMILRLYRGFEPSDWGTWEPRMQAATARIPTMVLFGDDPYLPSWLTERFGAEKVVRRREYGHFLPLQAPDWVAEEVAGFLGA